MFRTLRTRLIASYVFAAILLVLVATFAVTAFALSVFGISAHESVDTVARAAPDEVRLALTRYGTLEKAAPEIVRHLVRPGVGIVLLEDKNGVRRFLGGGIYDNEQPQYFGPGPPTLGYPHNFGPPNDPFVAATEHALSGRGHGPGAPPGGPHEPMYQKIPPFPLGLNLFLRLEPKNVEGPGWRVRVLADPRSLVRTVNASWTAMLPLGLLIVIAAWFLGRYIAGQALRPLVETTAALNRFAAGDFTPRPVVAADRNEIGELVTAYNGAVAQVNAAFEERRSVELHMRQFVADASHELRTPLTVIMGFIEVLRRRTANEAAISSKIYDTMLVESRRMKSLIDKLIALARLENPQASPDLASVDLADMAGGVVDAARALHPQARIALSGEPIKVFGSSHELREAISNLLDNALKYGAGSPVVLSVRAEGDEALVEVADRGPGLSAEDREHVFDRFYRGQNRGDTEGHGLGLAIVKRAVERGGGSIELESEPGNGCRFTIRLPREHGESSAIAV